MKYNSKYLKVNNLNKPILRIFIILFLYPFLSIKSQYGTKAEIKNVDFKQVNERIFINYDLVKARSKDIFDLKVEVFNSYGNKIEAQTFEGQFSGIKKGKNKQIIWNIGEDYINLEDNIYFELTAIHKNHKIINRVSRFEALCKSTFWPGWGSAQTTLKKRNYLRGIGGYCLLVTSSVYLNQANVMEQMSNNVILSFLKVDNIYEDKAKQYKTISRITLGAAAIVWLWEYGTILSKPNVSQNIHLDVYNSTIDNHTIPMLSLKANF